MFVLTESILGLFKLKAESRRSEEAIGDLLLDLVLLIGVPSEVCLILLIFGLELIMSKTVAF
jgi:hypothetical protein